MNSAKIFILTADWQDYKNKNILRFFGTSDELGAVEVLITNFKPFLFIEKDSILENIDIPFIRKEANLKTFAQKPVDVIYFNTQKDLNLSLEIFESINIKTYEADIDPVKRFLMERNINAQFEVFGKPQQKNKLTRFVNPKIKPCDINPKFKIISIDIETSPRGNSLYSIAVHLTKNSEEEKKIFMIGDENYKNQIIEMFQTESDLLENFIKWFNETDPDIIIGWHVIGFDLMFLARKCETLNIEFKIGRGNNRAFFRKTKFGNFYANVPGRVVIDGPPALRNAFYTFDDFKLETVAQELLRTGKTISSEKNKVREIERLFKEDKQALAEYNIQDTILVTNIFKKTGLVDLSVKRSKLSGLLMEQLGMMSAAFDHFYLPKIHKAGYVAPNIKDIKLTSHSAGGYVIDPKPGIYNDVIVLDFKSLYPSIIQTFKIDPLSRLLSNKNTIKTPVGINFSLTENFLPDFITHLMEQRKIAKEKNDVHLSQSIKILMNSFYGVMGAYTCRFYHPDLPSAITETGHWLLIGSKEKLEEQGYNVIYGDTDSLFVKLKEGEGENPEFHGEKIAANLNNYWQNKILNEFNLKSFLELEYEKYYEKFIITPARGGETGAKKRYAGMVYKNGRKKLEFVGMEFVRSDWTKLAKEFQVELYEKIFSNQDITDWIKSIVLKITKGDFDEKLIYKKRLRKDVNEYVKNIPPQVRAAKMITENKGTIEYFITKRGPIPAAFDPKDIDYNHYIEKQLKPIADSVLILLGKSFDEIADQSNQLNLF